MRGHPIESADPVVTEHILMASNSFQQIYHKEKYKAEFGSNVGRKARKRDKETSPAPKKKQRRKTELPQISKSMALSNPTEPPAYKPPAFNQPSSALIEQMVIDGSEMHQKQKQYVQNKLSIDLNNLVNRLAKSQRPRELSQSQNFELSESKRKPG